MSLTYIELEKPIHLGVGVAGVYKLIHDKTGKVYVGSGRDVTRAIRTLCASVASKSSRIKELVDLYSDDPNFTAQYIRTEDEQRIFDIEQKWIDEYTDTGLLINCLDDTDYNPGAYQLIHTTTGKVYVGSTNDLERRIKEHMRLLKNGKHAVKNLLDAFLLSPDITVKVFKTDTKEEALELEQSLIDRYKDSGMLFNIADNARYSALGREGGDYQKNIVRQIHTGKIVSEETRQRLRDINTGKVLSADHVEKIRANSIDKFHADEAKEKVRQSKMGIARPDDLRARLSAANKGKVFIRRKVSINGVVYSGVREAAKHHNLARRSIMLRLNKTTDEFKDWFYI